MRKTIAIIRYEYKMQFLRPAAWGIFLAVVVFALLDNYPSAANLARLEFLNEPAYFVYRTVGLNGFVLLFGLMFLLADRFLLDEKTGMKLLLMSHDIQKKQYILGKLLGGVLYTFSMLCIFLTVTTTIYFAASSFRVSLSSCIIPLIKAIFVSALPASLFVGLCSVALPGIMDIRLFYLLSVVLFGMNAAYVGSAYAAPFYMITSGDLIRFIWENPKWPFHDIGSIFTNALFLVGTGLVSGCLLFCKHSFWRAE